MECMYRKSKNMELKKKKWYFENQDGGAIGRSAYSGS